jgi:hypothetical protein
MVTIWKSAIWQFGGRHCNVAPKILQLITKPLKTWAGGKWIALHRMQLNCMASNCTALDCIGRTEKIKWRNCLSFLRVISNERVLVFGDVISDKNVGEPTLTFFHGTFNFACTYVHTHVNKCTYKLYICSALPEPFLLQRLSRLKCRDG